VLTVCFHQGLGWLCQYQNRGDLCFKCGSLYQSYKRIYSRWCLNGGIRQRLQRFTRMRFWYIAFLQVWRRRGEEVRDQLLQWRFVQWRQSTNGQHHHALGMRSCGFSSLIYNTIKKKSIENSFESPISRSWVCIMDIKFFSVGTVPIIVISNDIFFAVNQSVYIIYSVILFFSKTIFDSLEWTWSDLCWRVNCIVIKVFYLKPWLLSVNLCLAVKTMESVCVKREHQSVLVKPRCLPRTQCGKTSGQGRSDKNQAGRLKVNRQEEHPRLIPVYLASLWLILEVMAMSWVRPMCYFSTVQNSSHPIDFVSYRYIKPRKA